MLPKGELTPPYTPRRYLEAIEEFLAYGVDILVVDSFSHCWEGPGGVLEITDQAEENGRKGLLKWLGPKRDYKKLVSSCCRPACTWSPDWAKRASLKLVSADEIGAA